MKKRGFTLVELLAVIAILAILVIIALPNVMNMFNTAKKNSFITELKTIYTAAEQTWMLDNMNSSSEMVYARGTTEKCEKELDLTGRTNLYYYIRFDQGGNIVEYYATDGTFQFQSDKVGLKKTDIEDVDTSCSYLENENEGYTSTISCSYLERVSSIPWVKSIMKNYTLRRRLPSMVSVMR